MMTEDAQSTVDKPRPLYEQTPVPHGVDELLTVGQVCAILKVSRSTVAKLIREKKLGSFLMEGSRRIKSSALGG